MRAMTTLRYRFDILTADEAKAQFNERLHPRDREGQFAHVPGGGGRLVPDIPGLGKTPRRHRGQAAPPTPATAPAEPKPKKLPPEIAALPMFVAAREQFGGGMRPHPGRVQYRLDQITSNRPGWHQESRRDGAPLHHESGMAIMSRDGGRTWTVSSDTNGPKVPRGTTFPKLNDAVDWVEKNAPKRPAEPPADRAPSPDQTPDDLDKLKGPALRELARSENIPLLRRATVPQIRQAIRDVRFNRQNSPFSADRPGDNGGGTPPAPRTRRKPDTKPPTPPLVEADRDELDNMRRAALVALAEQEGIPVLRRANAAQIRQSIRDVRHNRARNPFAGTGGKSLEYAAARL